MSRVDRTRSATVHLIQHPGQKERQIGTRSDMRVLLETLLDSARALSNNPALSHALASVDQIPALEAEIKRRDAQEEIAKSGRQQALDDYAIQRDNWKAEKERFQETIESLQKELSQEKGQLASLSATKEQDSRQISSLQGSLAESNLNAENDRKQIQGLIKAMESERHKIGTLNKDLEQRAAEVSQARAEAHAIQKAHEKAKKQADYYRKEVDTAASLKVAIVDDAKVIDRIHAVWRRAASVICTTFYGNIDLIDSKTKTFWATYEQKSGLSDVLPLPRSNSEAAVQARCVAILAYLARIFARDLLQPNYLLPEESDMRELLVRQAYENPAKATAFRASLQALLPAAQEEAVDERTEKACNTIASLTYGILPDREDVQYRSQLRSLAEEASQAWYNICCFIDTIEARFDTRRHKDWNDNKFFFEEKQYKIRRLDSLSPDVGDEPIIAIFPRLYAIYEGYCDLETPGVFWMRTQAKASQDELEKAALSARVGKGHPRQQRVRPRHGSVELSTDQTMATTQSFLDQSSGHD